MHRAFTLIELLVVIAIIAILAAILFPVFLAARAAAYQWNAGSAIDQLGKASTLYCNDYDDTYPLAMYFDGSGFRAWYGRFVSTGVFDTTQGLLSPYEKSQSVRDITFNCKPFLGDHSGFGYNWGFIGSDFHMIANYSTFPQCMNAATNTSLSNPSNTVVFGTSAFYYARWLPKGDGQIYDFGFIDPIGYTANNPNVDFRHLDQRKVDNTKKTISFPGNGLFVFADSHVRALKIGQLPDVMFMRDGTGQGSGLNGNSLP